MVHRKGELTSVRSIQAGHIKSHFRLMPALARDTMWFMNSAVAYLSALCGSVPLGDQPVADRIHECTCCPPLAFHCCSKCRAS